MNITARLRWPRRAVSPALVFILLTAFFLLMQWLGGVWEVELAANPDEPAHYVTALMIRSYAAHGFPSDPIRFAESFYVHYPKVAFGHWPPVFHVLGACWMLLFGTTSTASMVLIALLAGALSLGVWLSTGFLPMWNRVGTTALFAASQPMMLHSQLWMTELLLGCLCLAAVMLFSRWMDDPSPARALAFAAAASAAMLTNGPGIALALMPPMAIAFSGRWHLLREPSLWLAAAISGTICGPWYAWTANRLTTIGPSSAEFTASALISYPRHLVNWLGLGIAVLAIAGAIQLRRKKAAIPAVIAAMLLFQSVAVVGISSRYVFSAIAPVFMLAGAGLMFAARTNRWLARAALALIVVTLPVRWSGKESPGAAFAVQGLLARPDLEHGVILAAGSSLVEGGVVAEVARRDVRPNHFVLRGTKALSSCTWSGRRYVTRFANPEQLGAYLESVPVDAVIVGKPDPPYMTHVNQLFEYVEGHPGSWLRLSSRDATLQVFVNRQAGLRPRGPIRVPLTYTLGRVLEER